LFALSLLLSLLRFYCKKANTNSNTSINTNINSMADASASSSTHDDSAAAAVATTSSLSTVWWTVALGSAVAVLLSRNLHRALVAAVSRLWLYLTVLRKSSSSKESPNEARVSHLFIHPGTAHTRRTTAKLHW
jgi:hypothetical protein